MDSCISIEFRGDKLYVLFTTSISLVTWHGSNPLSPLSLSRRITHCTIYAPNNKGEVGQRVFSGAAVLHPGEFSNNLTGVIVSFRRAVENMLDQYGYAPKMRVSVLRELRRRRWFAMEGNKAAPTQNENQIAKASI